MNATDRTPVVWLVNEGGHDYTTAEKFGRIMAITTGSINPFNPDRLMVIVGNRLRNAAESDFVVISGSPLLNALVLAMWTRRFPTINVLVYSHRDKEYKPLTIATASIERLANAT